MTKEEKIQKELDYILPPLNRFGRAKKANILLSDKEKAELYDVVDSFNKDNKNWYLESIDKVVSIIKKHPEFDDYAKGYNEDETPLVSTEMPLFVKQVLFYIYYVTKNNNRDIRTKLFLSDLESVGLKKTKKLLNVGGMTPEGYFDMVKYQQPANPCLYKGQKKDELAYAIKNLAYQAGAYSYFVDIFGGSAAATTALYPQDRVKQVYNEKNLAVYNLMKVLATDDYKELKKAIHYLKEDLWNTDYSFSPYFGVSDFFKTINSNNLNEGEREVFAKWGLKFEFEEKSVEKCISSLNDKLFQLLPVNISIDDYDINTMQSWKSYDDFREHYKTIEKAESLLKTKYFNNNRVSRVNGNIVDGKKIVYRDYFYGWYKINVIQVKALIYYLYFNNIRYDERANNVERAVGEIFLHNLSTQGDIISSSILGFDRDELDNKRNELRKFLSDDFNEIVDMFHERVKRCETKKLLRNCDFKEVINEFANIGAGVLFYSDSPYDSTSDYKDEDAMVNAFTPNDMSTLISMLKNSNKKFIFSMRAVGTGKDIKERKKVTKSIYKNVFEVFKEKKIKNLHVLCILKKQDSSENSKSDREQLIENYKNGVSNCEIMLTNYQIAEFKEWRKSKTSKTIYKFEVYKFADFMKIIEGVI